MMYGAVSWAAGHAISNMAGNRAASRPAKLFRLCLLAVAVLQLVTWTPVRADECGDCWDCEASWDNGYGTEGELWAWTPAVDATQYICEGSDAHLKLWCDDVDRCDGCDMWWYVYHEPLHSDLIIRWTMNGEEVGSSSGPHWCGGCSVLSPCYPNDCGDWYLAFATIPSAVLPVGTHTIVAAVDDIPACEDVNDAPATQEFTIIVKPKPPTCPPAGSKQGQCDNGGGCGGGSCGGGGGEFGPMPSPQDPVVPIPKPVPPSPVGPWPDIPTDDEDDSCKKAKAEVFDTCMGFYVRVTTRCSCQVFGASSKPESGENTYDYPLDDGGTVHIVLSSTGGVSATVSYPDGSQEYYTVPPPSETTFVSESGPDSVRDADGNETIITRGETYDTVTTPTSETWRYYHDRARGDPRVTRIQRTDVANAPYVQIDYVTEGNDGEGRPSSIQVRDAGNNVLSETAYSYYPSGEIKTATNGDRQLYYEYSADPLKITVTERLTDSETVIYGKTEYWYGKVGELGLEDPPGEGRDENRPGQYATWVTRIDPANPANNQRTRYLYNHVTQGSEEIRTYLHSMTDPLGTTTTYTYDQYKPGRVTQVDVTNGETFVSRTAYQYDWTFGAVTSVTRLDASNQSLGEETYDYYPGTLWLRTHKDVRGNFTHYDRVENKPWQVSAVKMAPGPYEPYDWDDPYDTTIQILKQYEYYGDSDPNGKPGQLKKEIVPLADGVNGQVTEYRYSRNGVFCSSPTETIYKDASGTPRTSATYYDAQGRVEKTVDANGRAVWYRYDDLGRSTLTVYKWANDVVDGTPEVYTENHYNCCSLEWSRDENGNKTYYAYDDAKRVTKVWTDTQNPNGEAHPLVEYTYDAFGNKKTVTTRSDANTTRVTTYTYDKLNRVTKIEYPGGIVGDEEFGYDVAGNLWWKKDGNADVTLYEYDGHNRLWKVYYNYTGSLNPPSYEGLTPDVTYGYQQISDPYWPEMVESHGNLKTSMTDASWTSRYYYDIQGRLIRYVPPTKDQEEYVIAYTYNNLGGKTSVRIGPPEPQNGNNFYYWEFGVPYVLPLDEQNIVYDVSYEYFANGWLKKVKSGSSSIVEYSYDAVGNRIQQTNGNGTSTEYAFDSDSRYRVTSITHKRGSNVLAQIGYPSRDSVGNPLGTTDSTGTWGYDYDSNNRLVGATPPNPVPGQPAGGDYEYDWVGNRTHPPGDPNPMVYNDGDQLVRWTGMYRYSYDGAGNLVQVRNDSQTQVLKSYTYTPAGLLATATFRDKGGNTRTFSDTWDADSNRVGMNANGTQYSFVCDTTAGIPAVIEESSGGSTAHYIREPGGSLIARLNSTDGIRYYHFDELGSTRLLTDSTGAITDRYTCDTYGSLLSHDAYTGSVHQPYQYVGQLGYYTHYQEPEFGLLQLGVRFYDAEVGRFGQSDSRPVDREDGFTYCYGRPTKVTDPSGRFPWDLLTCPRACKGINECSWTGDKCRDCAFSLMVDPQYWSANVIKMLGSIRGGISSGTLTDAMAKCWPEAEEFCIKKHSGSMTVLHFAECVAGKIKIDLQTILKVLKAILKGKAEGC